LFTLKRGKHKISVLYLDNTFTFGGAINSLLYLLRALDKDRFDPVLITGQPKDFLQEKFDFIEWYHIPLKLPWIHNRLYKKITSFKLFKDGIFRFFINKIRFLYWFVFITLPEAVHYYKIGKKHNARIVHLNNIFGNQLAGILAAKLLGVPCVAHMRCFEEVSNATQLYARLIDHHIAISGAIMQNMLELGVSESEITTIFDAIDLDEFDINISCEYLRREFDISVGTNTFGIFGRIMEWKGIIEFVHAAALVCKTMPGVRAFIVGDTSDGGSIYYDEVICLIRSYGLEKSIILTGYRDDIPALMKMMDVVVHASITPEPFGMVLIEAMAMGKPVIATKNGGPLDIVEDQKTGFWVDPGDYTATAGFIEFLISDSRQAHDFGINGQVRVQKLFSKERYALEVERVYDKLIRMGE